MAAIHFIRQLRLILNIILLFTLFKCTGRNLVVCIYIAEFSHTPHRYHSAHGGVFVQHYSHKKVQNLFEYTTFRITYTNLDVWFKFQYTHFIYICAHTLRCHLSFKFFSHSFAIRNSLAKSIHTRTHISIHIAEPFANNISQKHIFHLGNIQNMVGESQSSFSWFACNFVFFFTTHSRNPSQSLPSTSLILSIFYLFISYSLGLVRSTTLVFSLLFGKFHIWLWVGEREMKCIYMYLCKAQMNSNLRRCCPDKGQSNSLSWMKIRHKHTHTHTLMLLFVFLFFSHFPIFFFFFYPFAISFHSSSHSLNVCLTCICFGSSNKIADIIRK